MKKIPNSSPKEKKKKPIKILIVIAALLLLCLTTYAALKTPRPPHLTHSSTLEIARLKEEWEKGNVIAFVRHAERCDQSTATCLDSTDGITVPGKDVAVEVGDNFRILGINTTDIFTSPLKRTQQTADYMFDRKIQSQEWLANCQNTILHNATNNKSPKRNLVLITHSDCMKDIERSLNYSTSEKPDYSSALMVSYDDKTESFHIIGIIDPKDWNLSLKN